MRDLPKEIAENGGSFEVIQFWVNVAAARKMEAAQYTPLEKESELQSVYTNDPGVQIRFNCRHS